jgi:hypothetical protein
MTSAMDERSAKASWKIPGSADAAARLVPHHFRFEHRSGLAAFESPVKI